MLIQSKGNTLKDQQRRAGNSTLGTVGYDPTKTTKTSLSPQMQNESTAAYNLRTQNATDAGINPKATAKPTVSVTPPSSTAAPATPPAPKTADVNYQKQNGETDNQYTARVNTYNDEKNQPSDGQTVSDQTPTSKAGTVTGDVPYGTNQRKVTYADGTSDIVDQSTDKNGNVQYTPNALGTKEDTAQTQLDALNADYQTKAAQVSKTITNIQNGIIPLNDGEQAQVAGLQQSYQTLIEQQQLQNTGAAGAATVRGYQTGAAEYDPTFSIKTIGNIVSAGNAKVADLNTQMASAVAALTQGFKDSDINAVKDSWAVYQDAADKRTTALQKTIDDANAAIKDAQDAQQKIQDNIDTVAEKAAENGADAATLAKINAAGSTGDAISAAGVYLQSATGQLGDYLQYKKDTIQQGLTPSDYASWKAADDARQAKADANAAYSKAYATAQGAAAATGTADGSSDITPDPTSGGITQAAGISLQAFNYLTQGTASLSRLSAAQRNQIIGEADAFLKKNNIDVSTFQSQYKAYNDVLEKNVERANNTKIFGDEISGTVDQFVNDIGTDFGTLSAGNVAKLFAGKQVNDPTVQKYAFDLKTMQNDLAGYYAASRGSNSPDQSDLEAASQVITSGIGTKSALAFQQAINDNEKKVTGVVNTAVNSAQKSVWDLFGVGAQYQPKGAQVNPKDAVDSYVQDNPDKATMVGQLYNVPGTTDQDVLDYINHAFSQ